MLVRLYDQREWIKLAPSRIFAILAIVLRIAGHSLYSNVFIGVVYISE